MGNTQPTNKTGRKVVLQKLENAKKTGVLSLSEHKVEDVPEPVFHLENLRTLDLSKNHLTHLSVKLCSLKLLKSLNLEYNKLTPGSVDPIANLGNLQILSLGNNLLGKPTAEFAQSKKGALPELPLGLKSIKLDSNHLSSIPRSIMSAHLTKLEKLDLSKNNLASVPMEIAKLKQLNELNLDDNVIVSLPQALGLLNKLKVLSLRNNHISVQSTAWSDKNPQPLPASLFSDTPLIDLNLHGNPMTATELNQMEGFQKFLDRRQKVKTSAIIGGAMTNMDVCGLE